MLLVFLYTNKYLAMRSLFLLFLILSVACYSTGQINSYRVVSSKEYADNTKTFYLEFDVSIDASMKEIITQELISNPQINHFSFYNKADLSKCMFTSDMSVDADMVVQMINDIIENNIDGSRFVNVWTNSTGQELFFQIEGITSDLQRKQIAEVLMKDTHIVNAVLNGFDCKIIVKQEITPEYVQIILDKFNVVINPASIK